MTTPQDIEQTRTDLSRNLDELTDKVSPGRVVERRTQAIRGRFSSAKDKVMGAAPSSGGHSGTGSPLTDSVSDTAGGAKDTVAAKTQGNPLAAGLIAFGAGLVIASLIPASKAEADLAHRAVDTAQDQGLVDEAKSVGQEVATDLKDSAQESAQQVKESAQDSAQTVQEEGRSSAQTVRDSAT